MFCENCKKELPDFPKVCPACGKRTSLYGINLDTVEGIKSINPRKRQKNVDMLNELYYILQRKATVLKREKKMDLAIECLRKSNEISDTYIHPPLLQKDYMRLVSFLKLAKREQEAAQAEREINLKHPEFLDKRVSNLKRIREEIDKAHNWGIDVVYITTSKTCSYCKHVEGKKFSISGRTRKYPKLPKELSEQGGFCPSCIVGISLDYEDFLN